MISLLAITALVFIAGGVRSAPAGSAADCVRKHVDLITELTNLEFETKNDANFRKLQLTQEMSSFTEVRGELLRDIRESSYEMLRSRSVEDLAVTKRYAEKALESKFEGWITKLERSLENFIPTSELRRMAASEIASEILEMGKKEFALIEKSSQSCF